MTDRSDEIRIKPMLPTDWPAVAGIYRAGIATGNVTFETASPPGKPGMPATSPDFVSSPTTEMLWSAGRQRRVSPIGAVMAESSSTASTLTPTATAAASAGSSWKRLSHFYRRRHMDHTDRHLPENIASVALHQTCGFRIVGRRERIGQLNGVWRDVLLLERRAPGNT